MLRSHALALLPGFLFLALQLTGIAFLVLCQYGVTNQGPSGSTNSASHSGTRARGAESSTPLRDANTMLEWAKSMTWKGLKPVVELSRQVYAKGVKLSKTALQAVEERLERNPLLPKWDILIHPTKAT